MSRRTTGIAATVTIKVFALLIGVKIATAEHSVTDRSVASVTSPALSRNRRRIPPTPTPPPQKKIRRKTEEKRRGDDDDDDNDLI